MDELHYFDRTADFTIIERRLPHWVQPGVVCFITFRTCDSIPKDVLLRWRREREQWLRRHQINPAATDWRQRLSELDRDQQIEFHRTFSNRWHEELDTGHGECVLQNSELARIVGDSLQHAAGEKYLLTDFVVMPNHVHLLSVFAMSTICWRSAHRGRRSRRPGSTGCLIAAVGFGSRMDSII